VPGRGGAERRHRGPRWLTRGVAGVAVASFFSDAGHEITTSTLPAFVTTTLRASPGALGVIEGISDALVGLSKLVGGPLANDEANRLRMARGGYLVTAAATGAVGAATATWQAGILRGTAWAARGIRSPARDAMLATLAPREAYGRAFGLERAGDNLGAVVGPLLAAVLVGWIGIRHTMYAAAIPGLVAAVAIGVAAAEARHRRAPVRRRARLELRALRGAGLARAFVPIGLFELGNCAVTLLILRATHLLDPGRSPAAAAQLAIVLYAGHNACATAGAWSGGRWIDRAGPRRAFVAGALLFLGAYGVLALPVHGLAAPLLAFALAGTGIGLAETAESTIVAHRLPDEVRASGFGVLGGVQAGGDLAASAVVGVLWAAFSPTVAFGYAAALMLLAAVAAARTR
jgi:MFS family permease